MIKNKTRYIPNGFTKVELQDAPAGVEIYFGEYTSRVIAGKTKYSVIAYSGKRNSYDFYEGYGSGEDRATRVIKWLDRIKKHEQAVKERRAQRNQPHTLKVGDILNASWGYDQTNVDFFQVVEVPSKNYVMVKEIGQSTVAGSEGFMSCHVMPVKDNFINGWKLKGEAKRVKVSGNSIKVEGIRASLWDGRACYNSWYA